MIKVASKKDYELKLIEAERQLAILEYKNYKWHPLREKESK